MTIEQPRFPTPEDERRASLLYQALRELVEIEDDTPAPGAANVPERPAEA